MALYHYHIKCISRKSGKAIVAAAAYRSGKQLHDRYYGEIHNFTDKGGIIHTTIILPETAPQEFCDREILWNAVEYAEKRRDSRLAREVEVALPVELTLDENIRLIRQYVTDNFVEYGMIADVAIHDKGTGNPHAHILLTTREVSSAGFNAKKNREWDKRKNVSIWREEWAKMINREFERKGIEKELDHESYAIQGIEREPTIHLGHRVKEIERSDKIETDRGNENRSIVERNKVREENQLKRQFKRERHRYDRNR